MATGRFLSGRLLAFPAPSAGLRTEAAPLPRRDMEAVLTADKKSDFSGQMI